MKKALAQTTLQIEFYAEGHEQARTGKYVKPKRYSDKKT